MAGASNGIIGNEYGIDLPESRLDEQMLNEEKKKARYSRSAEYRRLKEYLDSRIEYHRNFLPGGGQLAGMVGVAPMEQIGQAATVSQLVILELQKIIDEYESAVSAVESTTKG